MKCSKIRLSVKYLQVEIKNGVAFYIILSTVFLKKWE